MRISVSSLNTFHACPHKYKLSYIDRLTKWDNDVTARSWGSLFHDCMGAALRSWHFNRDELLVSELIYNIVEAYSLGNSDPEIQEDVDQMCYEVGRVAWRTFQDMRMGEQYDTVTYREISNSNERFTDEFSNFEDYQKALDAGDVVMDDYPLVEYRFTHEDESGHTFTGYIDCVLRNLETGHIEVVDFKTKKKFSVDITDDYTAEQLKAQLPVYVNMLRRRGLDTRMYTIYQVLQRVPEVPVPIKDGSRLHKWTTMTTDYNAYLEGIRRYGFDEADYMDALEALSQMTDYYFRPLRIVVSDERAKRFVEESIRTANVIDSLDHFPMNLNWDCARCPFNDICMAIMEGQSYDDLIGTMYNVKDT